MTYKLDLSATEFRDLALALYLGNWLANAHSVPGEEDHPELEALLQKIYKIAKENKVPGLRIKKSGKYYDCMEHDSVEVDETQDIIRQYDERSMFETLARQLAARDTHEKLVHGKEPVAPEDVLNRLELETADYDEYMDEFTDHGIGRVLVDTKRHIPCEEDSVILDIKSNKNIQ